MLVENTLNLPILTNLKFFFTEIVTDFYQNLLNLVVTNPKNDSQFYFLIFNVWEIHKLKVRNSLRD
jgi:hypothetical protein